MPGQAGCRGGCVGSGPQGPRRRAPLAWRNGGAASSPPGRGHLGGFCLLSPQRRQAKRLRAFFLMAAAALFCARHVQDATLLRGVAVAGGCSKAGGAQGLRCSFGFIFRGCVCSESW